MNSRQNNLAPDAAASAEATLRLIASLPAPEGLEDRLKSGLRSTPHRAQLFAVPGAPFRFMHSPAVRGAAAAAIVCVVAGGGWQVYSHVQTTPSSRVTAVPARAGAPGGFSTAGAMRIPNTVNGPTLTHTMAPPSPGVSSGKAPAGAVSPSAAAPKPKKLKRSVFSAPTPLSR